MKASMAAHNHGLLLHDIEEGVKMVERSMTGPTSPVVGYDYSSKK
jgi:hypothetical protein